MSLEYYKQRCKQLEDVVNELALALWGTDIHLAMKVSTLLNEPSPEIPDEVKKENEKITTGKESTPGKLSIDQL